MPKKKSGNNGFYYFMLDLRDRHPKVYKNNQQAAEAAGSIWKTMNAAQKQPYEEKARVLKNKEKTRYTSSGQKVDVVVRQEAEAQQKIQNMKSEIETTVLAAVEAEKLPDEVFHFIHVNYFCCFHKDYYPAEISVVRWSLRSGVTAENIFSMMCKPGLLPVGYTAEAMKISEETHQIPLPDSPECNLSELVDELESFMMMSGRDCAPVYALSRNAPVVENVLQQLSDHYGLSPYPVFSLEHLFFTLRNSSIKGKIWLAPTLAQLELEKDKYEFSIEITCPFHEHVDIPSYCSQSITVRTVYTVCDHCCGDLNIDLIPGQHVPKNANISATVSRANSTTLSSNGAWDQVSIRHQTLEAGYLSRAETDVSELSECSTIDPNETLDSEFDDDWRYPKQKKKHGTAVPSSSQNDYTQTSGQILRRPIGLSNALAGLSIAGESRGRGRGIAANYNHK